MSPLPTPGFLMLQLKLKDIWPRRQLGQHFLTDERLLARIADAAGLGGDTLALEIGPGPGTLTTLLAARAGGVLAVELDRRLEPLHAEAFATEPTIEFLYADALRTDLAVAARETMARRGLESVVLTGNLPFQITSPLLFGQTGPDRPWRGMTVMVQREVADRIVSPPHSKEYGALTVKLGCWWRVRERFEVAADSFDPRPAVDAAVLVFERRPAGEVPSAEQWPGLSRFIDAAFAQRRKMLVNSLQARWPAFPGKPEMLAAFEALAIPPKSRAEDLEIDLLRRLCERLTTTQ